MQQQPHSSILQCWYRLLLPCLVWRCSLSFQLFIYGLGKVGRAVVQQAPSDWIVRGTTRRYPLVHDSVAVNFLEAPNFLADATHVLITIPPDASSTILQDLAIHLGSSACWIGFVSTTGVYGNHDGAWVTEESSLLCNTDSSAFDYVRFERDLVDLATQDLSCTSRGSPTIAIFRCAGLYGPERSALHTLWKQGQRRYELNDHSAKGVFLTNRIHEYDVARAIVRCMCQNQGGIYNLSDDEPQSRFLVLKYAAELLSRNGMHVPEMSENDQNLPEGKTDVQASKRESRRQTESKLVDNSKMKANLIDKLLYPTYREGLNAIVADKRNPWWKTPSDANIDIEHY